MGKKVDKGTRPVTSEGRGEVVDLPGCWSAPRTSELVMRLLRGEALDAGVPRPPGAATWARGLEARVPRTWRPWADPRTRARDSAHVSREPGAVHTNLRVSAFYCDSAATLLVNGQVVAAAQEERFMRKKPGHLFPIYVVSYCVAEAGLSPADLYYVGFDDRPCAKTETYAPFGPLGQALELHAASRIRTTSSAHGQFVLAEILRQEPSKLGLLPF